MKHLGRTGLRIAVLSALCWGTLAQAAAGGLSQQAVLSGSAQFGSGVALSAIGNTLIVGTSPTFGRHLTGARSAEVFTSSAHTWSLQARLPLDGFATGEVALSADGNEALVGATHGARDSNGFAEVFRRSGRSWRAARTFGEGGFIPRCPGTAGPSR
jgi:hypothetical protein